MTFIAPLWLLGLLPWGALVLYLLWGRRRRVDVPFLDLWQGPVEGPKARRAVQVPPVGLAAAILAILLALLAAARPALRGQAGGGAVTVVIDRGLTMSARGESTHRFRELAARAADALAAEFGPGPVELLTLPDHQLPAATRSTWSEPIQSLPPTAVDTRPALGAAIAERLSRPNVPIIVLTDQTLPVEDERLVTIPPGRPLETAGIVHISARQHPALQVMLRIRNHSPQTSATLRLSSDPDQSAELPIDLPRDGQRDYFIDLPSFGMTISAQLLIDDDLPADDGAHLVRSRTWPAIEPRAPIPPELQRLVEQYARLRPPSEQSARIAILRGVEALPVNEPAILLAAGEHQPPADEGQQTISISAHPITSNLIEPSLLADAAIASPPADPAWRPLIQRDGQILVGHRTEPARQVWVGFHSPRFAASADFVILWTNIFDWVGEGGEQFTAIFAGQLDGPWGARTPVPDGTPPGLWPGIYERTDGALIAVNAPDAPIEPPPPGDWRGHLARLAQSHAQHGQDRPLAPWLILAALICMMLAALTWRRDIRLGSAYRRSNAAQIAS